MGGFSSMVDTSAPSKPHISEDIRPKKPKVGSQYRLDTELDVTSTLISRRKLVLLLEEKSLLKAENVGILMTKLLIPYVL